MPPVTVVSDTTAYLPRELVEANGIELVSLYVNFGLERSERESEMPDFDAFYNDFRSAEQLPTTSQPSIGDFIAAYEPLLARGRDVVSIHISGGLSGTADAARQAADALQGSNGSGRVEVIDSTTAAAGLALVVLAAARRAQAGADLETVVATARQAREELKVWCSIDTLEYLKRSGRVGAASAWIGSTLKVKPIVTIESELTPVERVRTSARAFERMVDYARQRQESGADGWAVQHIQSPEEAQRLADRCRTVFGNEPAFVSEIGPVVGVHAGPGLLGLGAIPSALLK